MAHALYTNNATATLAAGISNSATTITLNSGHGSLFPSPTGGNYFYGTLTDAATGTLIEIVKVTSRTTDSMVVARGQQGTAAQAYNANDKFELRVTAGGLSELASPDAITMTGTLTLAGNAANPLEAVPKQQLDSTISAQIAANVVVTSTANAQAGTNNTEFMTPLRTRQAFNASGSAPVYACRAWVNFNGVGSPSIRGSGNITSVVHNGTGDYTINFTTAMPSANYAAISSGQLDTTGGAANGDIITGGYRSTTSHTTGSYRTSTVSSSGHEIDPVYFELAIFA